MRSFALFSNQVAEFVTELDEANTLMPASKTFRTSVEFGKVSKVAILALKSRVLLYAASDLHDGTQEPKGLLYDYTKASKWQDAADAAKAVIDIFAAANKNLVPCANATAYQKLFLYNAAANYHSLYFKVYQCQMLFHKNSCFL